MKNKQIIANFSEVINVQGRQVAFPSIEESYEHIFQDGSDGDVTISSGTVVFDRDMFYNNLTIQGTGKLDPNAYAIFVKNILDLSQAQPNAIYRPVNSPLPTSGTNAGPLGTAPTAASVGGNAVSAQNGTVRSSSKWN